MQSTATAVWQGGLKDGTGTVATASGVLGDQPYSFATRFEGAKGTNPEELIAAAHAGCFAMALSMILGEQGLTPERLEAEAKVTLEQVADGFAVTASHLSLRGRVPGAGPEAFDAAAAAAKAGCPVSKLLNAEITLDAQLVD
jgi:osmotically inducible protein OsmC